MTVTQTPPVDRLEFQVRRRFAVTVDRLYAAWITPAAFGKWITPKPFRTTGVHLDPRVGGLYSVSMESLAGEPRVSGQVDGEFLLLQPERRLDMTWRWSLSDMPATRVSVTFEAEGAGAILHLRHYDFLDPNMCDDYCRGWDQSFQNLTLLLGEARS